MKILAEQIEMMVNIFLTVGVGDPPFRVATHDRMLLQITGKVTGTMLTVEQQIYTWRVAEYTDPLFYGRNWCWATLDEALDALARYMASSDATEPGGWVRAMDYENGYRVRRSRVVDGVREEYEAIDD